MGEDRSLLIRDVPTLCLFCSEQENWAVSRDYFKRCFELEKEEYGFASYDALKTASLLIQTELQLGHVKKAQKRLQRCLKKLDCLDKNDEYDKRLIKTFKKLGKKISQGSSKKK